MFYKIRNVVLTLFLGISLFGHAESPKDSLRNNIKILVNKLDSLSKDSILESKEVGDPLRMSKKYSIFTEIFKSANLYELMYLINYHQNSVVKAYAYLVLMVRDYKPADKAIMRNFKPLYIAESDTRVKIITGDVFLKYISPYRSAYKKDLKGT